jgi:hypothetical protein
MTPAALALREPRREQRWQQSREEWQRQQDEANQEWWRRYNEYLGTDEWRRLRQLVFKRDNGICQGCYSAPATQVHYLTYRNVSQEFLWELVAVRDEWHDRYHGGREA